MIVFIAIAIGSALLLCGSLLFGHDHDADHDAAADHDHGVDGDGVSVFSIKVLATLTLGFGAFGALAMHFTGDPVQSSMWGVGAGIALAFLMYQMIRLIYSQQASTDISMDSVLGRFGAVVTSIEGANPGEVGINAEGRYQVFAAKSKDAGESIPAASQVKVVGRAGSLLVVEPVNKC